jgi:hypothetical protein
VYPQYIDTNTLEDILDMARRRKPRPPVGSSTRTEPGGTNLIGEKVLNHEQLQFKVSAKDH